MAAILGRARTPVMPSLSVRAGAASGVRSMGRRFLTSPATVALTGYTGAAFALTANTWRAPGTHIIGFSGDPAGYLWMLAWGPFALIHHLNPFFSTYLNAPEGFNLLWGQAPMPSFVMWPFTWGLGPVVSFNLLVTLSFSFSAWTMYLAVRRLTSSEAGAVIAGLLYGFGPYMIVQGQAHVVLTMQVAPPLLLILIHDAVIQRRWRARWVGMGIGAVLAAQLMTYAEPLVTDAIGAVAIGLPLAALNRRQAFQHLGHTSRVAALAVVSGVVLSLPALRTLLFGAQQLTGSALHPPNVYVNDLLNFVVPTDAHWLAVPSARAIANRFTGGIFEWDAYLGVPLILFLATGMVCLWKRRALHVTGIALLATATLSLGPSLHINGVDTGFAMPGAVFDHLPLVDKLLPARLALMTDFFAALMGGFIIAEATSASRRALPRAALWLGTMGALLPLLPALPYPTTALNTPEYFTHGRVAEIVQGSTALVVPYPENGDNDQGEVWQAEARMRFRMIGGYVYVPAPGGGVSEATPSTLGPLLESLRAGGEAPQLTAPLRARLVSDLRTWRAQWVIVGPVHSRSTVVSFLARLLGVPPLREDGVEVWHIAG